MLTVDNSDHVSSMVTGHQRSEMRIDRTAFLHHRKLKLEAQMQGQHESQILVNVRLYIDGFLNNTTDIEMKRIVTLAGGEVMYVSSHSMHALRRTDRVTSIGIQLRVQPTSSHLSSSVVPKRTRF